MNKLIAMAGLGAVLMATESGQWKPASETEKDVEYRVALPTKNACEVELRDVRASGKVQLSVTTTYLPHKARKAAAEERQDEVTIPQGDGAKVHVFGCEAVVGVTIQVRHE